MKEQFINEVKNILVGFGFSESNNQYVRSQIFIQPGQQLIINGQQINQPNQEIEVKHVVTELGDGYCCNQDDTNKQEFTQYNIQVFVKGELNGEYISAYYWNDIEQFKNELTKILNV